MRVPLEQISYMVAIFEAYDNEFLFRTVKKGEPVIVVWYPIANRGTLDRILTEFRMEFPFDITGFAPGMAGLDEVFPE